MLTGLETDWTVRILGCRGHEHGCRFWIELDFLMLRPTGCNGLATEKPTETWGLDKLAKLKCWLTSLNCTLCLVSVLLESPFEQKCLNAKWLKVTIMSTCLHLGPVSPQGRRLRGCSPALWVRPSPHAACRPWSLARWPVPSASLSTTAIWTLGALQSTSSSLRLGPTCC